MKILSYLFGLFNTKEVKSRSKSSKQKSSTQIKDEQRVLMDKMPIYWSYMEAKTITLIEYWDLNPLGISKINEYAKFRSDFYNKRKKDYKSTPNLGDAFWSYWQGMRMELVPKYGLEFDLNLNSNLDHFKKIEKEFKKTINPKSKSFDNINEVVRSKLIKNNILTLKDISQKSRDEIYEIYGYSKVNKTRMRLLDTLMMYNGIWYKGDNYEF